MISTALTSTDLNDESFDFSAVFIVRRVPTSDAFPPAVRRLIEQLDGRRSIRNALRVAQISEDRGVAVVKKLATLGVITTSDGSGFTALDQAFFSAPIEAIDECEEPFESWSERSFRWLVELAARGRRLLEA